MSEPLSRLGAILVAVFAVAVGIAAAVWTVHILTTAPDAGTAVVLLSLSAIGFIVLGAVAMIVLRVLGLPFFVAFKAVGAVKRSRAR